MHALMEVDLKRVLAYSTIENIGLVFIGLGLALAFKGALTNAIRGSGGAIVLVMYDEVRREGGGRGKSAFLPCSALPSTCSFRLTPFPHHTLAPHPSLLAPADPEDPEPRLCGRGWHF